MDFDDIKGFLVARSCSDLGGFSSENEILLVKFCCKNISPKSRERAKNMLISNGVVCIVLVLVKLKESAKPSQKSLHFSYLSVDSCFLWLIV